MKCVWFLLAYLDPWLGINRRKDPIYVLNPQAHGIPSGLGATWRHNLHTNGIFFFRNECATLHKLTSLKLTNRLLTYSTESFLANRLYEFNNNTLVSWTFVSPWKMAYVFRKKPAITPDGAINVSLAFKDILIIIIIIFLQVN